LDEILDAQIAPMGTAATMYKAGITCDKYQVLVTLLTASALHSSRWRLKRKRSIEAFMV
jgi:hypothetical protein